MKFFFPLATGDQQAERIYHRIVERLNQMGYQFTPHRVYQVVYQRDGKRVNETIGLVSDNGEIVLAIFEHEWGYFINTYSRGAVWGEPMIAQNAVIESATFFEE